MIRNKGFLGILFGLLVCTSAAAIPGSKTVGKLRIKSYTASESGRFANSHFIIGANEIFLIDAQLNKVETQKIISVLELEKKKFKGIFITSARPEHYLGLAFILAKYPGTKIWARAAVVDEIKKNSSAKTAAARVVVPEVFKKSAIVVDGETCPLMDWGPSSSQIEGSSVYVPELKVLIAGDLAFGYVHPQMKTEAAEFDAWMSGIQNVKVLGPIQLVMPGHGENASVALLDENINYLHFFRRSLQKSANESQALAQILRNFSKYKLPEVAEQSVSMKFFSAHKK